MAILKQGIELDVDNISVDLFVTEDGSALLEAFLVEDNNYVLVKEVLPEGIGYTFFEMNSLQRIEKALRYSEENGKLNHNRIDENHKSICEVVVDSKTGFEKVIEKIVNENDEIVYENTRERYSRAHIEPLINRYLSYKKQMEKNRAQTLTLIKRFSDAELSDKISILRGIFRQEWRNRCELGFENPELFLSKGLYKDISNDKQFEEALMEMLKLEEKTVDLRAQDMFDRILAYCES